MTANGRRKFRTSLKDLAARSLTLEAATDEVTDRFMDSMRWESPAEEEVRRHMDQASHHLGKARLEMNTVLALIPRKTST